MLSRILVVGRWSDENNFMMKLLWIWFVTMSMMNDDSCYCLAFVVYAPSATTRRTTTRVTIREATTMMQQEEKEDGNSATLTMTKSVAVGERENSMFKCDESVAFWQAFRSSPTNEENLERIQKIVSSHLINPQTSTSQSRAYWSSHLLRSGYFTLNAFLGVIATDVYQDFQTRFFETTNKKKSTTTFGKSAVDNLPETTKAEIKSPVLSPPTDQDDGGMLNRLSKTTLITQLMLEVVQVYQQDYRFVREGLFKFPWDAILRQRQSSNSSFQWNPHRQTNPFFVLSETRRTIQEAVAIFTRRNGDQTSIHDNKKRVSQKAKQQKQQNVVYPDYYQNDFHFQTDGWLSRESANVYESSTETLFMGRQDAMQRQTLIPLLRHVRTSSLKSKQPPKILEVACGTGRLGTFVRDHLPTAEMVYTDLSPDYLEKAKENDQYWRNFRGKQAIREEAKGSTMSTMPRPATFLQANAEDLPFDDESFDAVLCVYLFHELPPEAQARAASEMVRVLRPGGIIVWSDSYQVGDRPIPPELTKTFSNMNEPHYAHYVEQTFVPDLFGKDCQCLEKYMSSTTKTLSFMKKETTNE